MRPMPRTARAGRPPRTKPWRWLLGWIVILVGIVGIFLPLLPALILIPAGIALVGRRAWAIR